MVKLLRIAPEVPVLDLNLAIRYYEEKLGFQLAMKMPGGDYAIVERDGISIHLFQDDPRIHSPASMHIFTHDLEELYDELERRGLRISQGIVLKPWGNRDFRVTDEWGNELKFTEQPAEAE